MSRQKPTELKAQVKIDGIQQESNSRELLWWRARKQNFIKSMKFLVSYHSDMKIE